ncbi:MAG: TRAP transporter small permease subunit [Candidatus Nitricoxidivorans perseverans]|uniref:TRAP transporter small permease protein n=1 Tax=Candidatus Nitricoxidivorans perseverans TaxID=2975601 RepID=A0AA49FKJ9_9PROT|nr:MAG: TRAP transporter small permease subunit [Candidatus Nitricoxidivorans perseverans]
MRFLLRFSGLIDRLNERVGQAVIWLVPAVVLVSAGNALARKALGAGSNAFLEIQWYLFAALFLLGAGFTMLRQGHVRIDVLLGRFSRRTQVGVEIFGILCFLMPFVVAVIALSWPLAANAWATGEMSENAGGLPRWPVYALVPAGFLLLGLQGISELVKRIGFLAGVCGDPGLPDKTEVVE